jgi:hypothetical protein
MNLNNIYDMRFFEQHRKPERADARMEFDGMSADLFGSFLDDGALFEKTGSALLSPLDTEEREWLNDSPVSIMRNHLQPYYEDAEGFGARFIADELIRKMASQANPANMAFSIEQGKNKLDVNAVFSAGLLTCDIKPSSDLLANRIKRLKQGIERDIGKRMHLLVEISVV